MGPGSKPVGAGLAILVTGAVVVFASSSLALLNAYTFRSGYPYQSSVLAMQQLLCTSFGVLVMQVLPAERKRLRISRNNYLKLLLPFSFILAVKLFLQNKAVQYVSPAYYAMTASTLPVAVTFVSILCGVSKFKWSTAIAVVLVSVGGVLIKQGQVELSFIGFVLTMTCLGLDSIRLVMAQVLLQPLNLSGPAMMLLSCPQQCLFFFLNAVWVDSADIARRFKLTGDNGGFGPEFLPLVLIVCSLAVVVVLVNLLFIKQTNAIISSIITPLKDLCTVIMSDLFVDKRQETQQAWLGFTIACATSLSYTIYDIKSRQKEGSEASERIAGAGIEEGSPRSAYGTEEPLLKAEKKAGGVANIDPDSVDGQGSPEEVWMANDAYCVGFMCCGAGFTAYVVAFVYYFFQK